jgi:hypothetical protein
MDAISGPALTKGTSIENTPSLLDTEDAVLNGEASNTAGDNLPLLLLLPTLNL